MARATLFADAMISVVHEGVVYPQCSINDLKKKKN